jgi:hypothetical protein
LWQITKIRGCIIYKAQPPGTTGHAGAVFRNIAPIKLQACVRGIQQGEKET